MNENTHKKKYMRLAALRCFAIAITGLTIVGLWLLGFEESYAYVLVFLAVGYSVELLLETFAIADTIFMMLHIMFGLFFALFSVCIIRSVYMYIVAYRTDIPAILPVSLAKEVAP